MATTTTTAGQIMDRVAILLNDPDKTDYNYTVMLPYLQMAIDELNETMEESNHPVSNFTIRPVIIPVGVDRIYPVGATAPPGSVINHTDVIEVQEVSERNVGSNDPFVLMKRVELISPFPASNSLLIWSWKQQHIIFNPNGALTPRELEIQLVGEGQSLPTGPADVISTINSRSFLSYRTAALCALYIGENQSRAEVLDEQAKEAIERTTAISNKGRQQIMTRHKPFRAGYKSRGWI